MVILMKSDKSLVISKDSKIYQKESVMDKLIFLFPKEYNGIDMSNFTYNLTYIDPQGGMHTELLVIDEEPYKEDFVSCQLPVDTEITKYSGVITLSVSATWLDSETLTQYVLKTDSLQIEISKLSVLYEFIPDESLDIIDAKMLELNGKIEALERLGEVIDSEIPDDLSIDDNNVLRLSIDGTAIGDGVEILTSVQDNDKNTNDGILDIEDVESFDPSSQDQAVGIIDL